MGKEIKVCEFGVTFHTAHGPVSAVRDVNTVFREGEVTGLIGESGSGKSVLGMAILQLLPANARIEGSCLYGDTELTALSEKEMEQIRGKEIALIPQNPVESLNPVLRIGWQLTEAMTIHAPGKKAEAEQRYQDLMGRLGFSRPELVSRQYSFQLSGGMNQRMIAVLGLMNRPAWMIADEPTKGLDAILRRQVYEVLQEITMRDTRNMILITHDVALARKLSQKILVLYQGEILEQGTAADVLDHPAHPYTRGLIGSLPRTGMKPIGQPLKGREDATGGCVFYPRCPQAAKRCRQEHPREAGLENGRKVRCFLYEK